MAVHLADWNLRVMSDEDWRRHDLLIIRQRARWRDGYRRLLPIVRGPR